METCLPGDDLDVQNPYRSLGIASQLNLSSSMSSLSMGSLHSPTGEFLCHTQKVYSLMLTAVNL